MIGEVREKPTVAPDIAPEVVLPDDRRYILDEKVDLYFRGGAGLVIVVDRELRLVELHEGRSPHLFGSEERARSRKFSDLTIDANELSIDLVYDSRFLARACIGMRRYVGFSASRRGAGFKRSDRIVPVAPGGRGPLR